MEVEGKGPGWTVGMIGDHRSDRVLYEIAWVRRGPNGGAVDTQTGRAVGRHSWWAGWAMFAMAFLPPARARPCAFPFHACPTGPISTRMKNGLGCTRTVTASVACGRSRRIMAPGDFRHRRRFHRSAPSRGTSRSFGHRDCVAHVRGRPPVAPRLGDEAEAAARAAGVTDDSRAVKPTWPWRGRNSVAGPKPKL